ncbi:MAG: hypothetical protein O7J95_08275 [Planctomycetota bacterium]|nr:hypothetical protein [Planctomycetota bacterium]
MGLREWLARRRRTRELQKLLDEAFGRPELLGPTSLKPRHRNRCVVLGHDEEGGEVARIHFAILRHPRPYAFSRQHHEVVELYVYDLDAERIEVVHGFNRTREEGRDAAD